MSVYAHGRARRRALAVIAAWTAASGCADGGRPITEPPLPTEPPDRPAHFDVYASFDLAQPARGESGRWRIDAYLDPGLVDGLLRTASDTLWVDGAAVPPDTLFAGGFRRYSVVIPMSAADVYQRPIEIEPPTVEGLSADKIVLVGLGRPPPDTVLWSPGGDLTLRVSLPPVSISPPAHESTWYLDLLQDGTPLVQLLGSGWPPPELLIPAAYLSAAHGPILAALRSSVKRTVPDTLRKRQDIYHVTYHVGTQLSWWVTPEPP